MEEVAIAVVTTGVCVRTSESHVTIDSRSIMGAAATEILHT